MSAAHDQSAPSLIDAHGRVVRDLRLSVTPRCNFRCTYCDPMGVGAHEPPGTLLAEHFDVILRAAAGLGMESVRFTGGEPLLRKDLPRLIAMAHAAFDGAPRAGNDTSGAGTSGSGPVRGGEPADIAITTNASALAKRLPELMAAGLRRVNVSLDAVDPDAFRLATGGGDVAKVWEGVTAVEAAGLTPLKLNAVVVRGVNDSEVAALAALTRDKPYHMRFIEYMHLDNAAFGTYDARFVPGSEIRAAVEAAHGELESVPTDPSAPARLFRVPGWAGNIGFINPVSEPFCSACSRMRVTSDGMLRPCLLNDREFDLKPALLQQDPVTAVQDVFLLAAGRKVASGLTSPVERPRTMVAIGG
jgi:cyclic pyranopterin phosphate synthase